MIKEKVGSAINRTSHTLEKGCVRERRVRVLVLPKPNGKKQKMC